MLVLSRMVNEDIIITPKDENGKELPPICIKLVSAERGKARIGIEAPMNNTINRREIQEVIDKNNKKVAIAGE